MSIRPELPYAGNQVQRLTAALQDLARQVRVLQVASSSLPVTRGKFTATFAASASASATITVPSTLTDVGGIASSGFVSLVGINCFVVNNGNGTATITAITATGANVTGSVPVYYTLWPM